MVMMNLFLDDSSNRSNLIHFMSRLCFLVWKFCDISKLYNIAVQ